jgi:adenylate cyclase
MRVAETQGDEIAVLAHSFNVMTAGLAERERLRQEREELVHVVEEEEKRNRELAAKNAQIRRFLAGLASSQVAQQFLEERPQLDFRGSTEDATILFADIRGFTTMCERLEAEEIFGMLNDYFPRMRAVIDSYGGCILKFMGDALMVSWNVPSRQDHPALRAVMAGIDMQREILKMNRDREAAGKDPINVGIGVNTGRLMVGNVGSEERFDYTVIGDAVNTAQRIESITPAQHLHISESTWLQVRDFVETVAREPVYLKGKEKPVQIYAVVRKKKGVVNPLERAR